MSHESFLPVHEYPRPEYPRPLLEREQWMSLNGNWQFAFDDDDMGLAEEWFCRDELEGSIVVPFSYQTELSGIHDTAIHETVWYRKSFDVPSDWDGKNVLLHFGAVDYYSTVWINGEEVGGNEGGSVPFSFDATPYLKQNGETNSVVLRAYDPQAGEQPRGKQSVSGMPRGIMYENTTGIWQPVWLEAAPIMRFDDVRITPREDCSGFEVETLLHAPSSSWTVEVDVTDEDGQTTTVVKEANSAVIGLNIPLDNPKLWAPGSPHLYDFTFRLYNDEGLHDVVRSYGGLRRVEIHGKDIYLNGEPVFLLAPLNQGYWPGGGLTAPTDEAFRQDIQASLDDNFNWMRLHQKVEDPRMLYWCDKLGMLVSGEIANVTGDEAKEVPWTQRGSELLVKEWERTIHRDYNHPSIIMWVPINESWGVPNLHQGHPAQFRYLEHLVSLTRRLDATRPVIDDDGWEQTDITDIVAMHNYRWSGKELADDFEEFRKTGMLRDRTWAGDRPTFARNSKYHGQPIILSEIGAFILQSSEMITDDPVHTHVLSAYRTVASPEELGEKYRDLMINGVFPLLDIISGACYTQDYDIYPEENGLRTFNRERKTPEGLVREVNEMIHARFKRIRGLGSTALKSEDFIAAAG